MSDVNIYKQQFHIDNPEKVKRLQNFNELRLPIAGSVKHNIGDKFYYLDSRKCKVVEVCISEVRLNVRLDGLLDVWYWDNRLEIAVEPSQLFDTKEKAAMSILE